MGVLLLICRVEHILIHMDDERINKAVGAELRAARARRDWSREHLAKQSGVTVISIRRYERGERAVPVDSLVRLMSALGIDMSDIDRAIRRESSNDLQGGASASEVDSTFLAIIGKLESDGTDDNGEQIG